MNTQPTVAVIILSWNGSKLLSRFLPSVVQHTNDINVRIIVADNGSTDDSKEIIQRFSPKVEWLPLGENYGFARGYNEAIRRVEADYVVLLNQDVEVTDSWIQPVIDIMEKDYFIAAVQPKIKAVNNPAFFEYAGAAGGWMDKYGYPFCRGRLFDTVEEDKGQFDDASEIAWASGACLFTRKKIYEQTGGLDGDLFAHMEEIDLCWRMKNEGFKIMYCPDSTIYHLGGASLPQGNPFKVYLNFRNSLIILYKNLPEGTLFNRLLMRALLDKVAAWRSLLTGNFSDTKAIIKAWYHFLKYMGRWKKKRKELKKLVKNPDTKGFYNGSVVLDYFVRGKKKFENLSLNKRTTS